MEDSFLGKNITNHFSIIYIIFDVFNFRATDPTRISLTFFCNNVDEESASANVELGKLDYDEHTSTKLKCNNGVSN